MSDALDRLAAQAVPGQLAVQLVNIVGPGYAESVYQTFTVATKKLQDARSFFTALDWRVASIHHLNRRLRLSGYRALPIDLDATGETYAIRACHGLRYLAKHAPFPDGS